MQRFTDKYWQPSKGKFALPIQCRCVWGVEVQLHCFLTLESDGSELSGLYTWIALPIGKEPLLPYSVLVWVAYSGALDVLQKRKLPCSNQESNPVLSCP